MLKVYTCFCGEIFHHWYFYQEHTKTCDIYQNFKNTYLSQTNINYMLTIRKNCKDILRDIFPYNTFTYGDYQNAVRDYPARMRMRDGTYLTKEELRSILNKDKLYQLYIIDNLDVVDIQNYFSNRFSITCIMDNMKRCGIPIRSRSDATKHSLSKMKATCLKNMGVENASQSQIVKNKKIETALKHSNGKYTHHFKNPDKVKDMMDNLEKHRGVRNVSQLESVQKQKDNTCYLHNKVKNIFENVEYIKQCTKKKLGVDNASKLLSVKLKKFLKNEFEKDNNIKFSKESVELFDSLSKKFDIFLSSKFRYATHGKETVVYDDTHFCSLDFSYIDASCKLAIEYNGDLWHANPNIYKFDDHPNFENKSITSQDIWNKDKDRLEFLKSKGYKVMVVWEQDYHNNRDKVIKECVDFINNQLSHKKDIVEQLKEELS